MDQLDECEITLKDLSEIKNKFEYTLTGIFHRRISYPEIQKKEKNGMKLYIEVINRQRKIKISLKRSPFFVK